MIPSMLQQIQGAAESAARARLPKAVINAIHTRQVVIDSVSDGPLTIAQAAEVTGMSKWNVREHLMAAEVMGTVRRTNERPVRFYRVSMA